MLCGCKGTRSCYQCENSERVRAFSRSTDENIDFSIYSTYIYCCLCGKIVQAIENRFYSATELANVPCSLLHTSTELTLNTVTLVTDFLSEKHENQLMNSIDAVEWLPSQSGRRKQDFGPKVNFKQQKLKLTDFHGMPSYADELLEMMSLLSPLTLSNYIPVEMCNLEYEQSRGSQIVFHIDDTWIWGNRLISINLLNGSVMTLKDLKEETIVFIYMPRRSLLCIADDARYNWKHAVLRDHISDRRIALTMRECESKFAADGTLFEKFGCELLKKCNLRVQV